jgi:hypothetical protein
MKKNLRIEAHKIMAELRVRVALALDSMAVAELSRRAIVSPNAVKRLRDGEDVRWSVAARIAAALGLEVRVNRAAVQRVLAARRKAARIAAQERIEAKTGKSGRNEWSERKTDAQEAR